VRRKLRDTTLTADSNVSSNAANAGSAKTNGRGRLNKKRSYEDIQNDSQDVAAENKDSAHQRKRSRDSKADGSEASRETREITPERSSSAVADPEKLLSPKKKRSIDQLQNDDQKMQDSETTPESGEAQVKDSPKSKNRAEGEPEKKRHRDSSQDGKALSESNSKVSSPFFHTDSIATNGTCPSLLYQALFQTFLQSHPLLLSGHPK
jgi:hypothetical protein